MSRQEKLAALASTGVTKAELDNIDGGTARGTTSIADGDGVLINDAGTMRMTSVETMATYMGTKIGGGMEFLASSGAISNAATVAFTQFDATKYDHYKFFFQHVTPATDAQILIGQVSTDGGSNYDTTSGNYKSLDAEKIGLAVAPELGSASGENGVSGEFSLWSPHNANVYTFSTMVGTFRSYDDNYKYSDTFGYPGASNGSAHLVTQDVDAIQFKFGSGNIESGEITMFGIVNS